MGTSFLVTQNASGSTTFGVFRHTFASRLAQLGVAEHVIADRLGHARKRTSITSRYVSVFGPEYVRAMRLLWEG